MKSTLFAAMLLLSFSAACSKESAVGAANTAETAGSSGSAASAAASAAASGGRAGTVATIDAAAAGIATAGAAGTVSAANGGSVAVNAGAGGGNAGQAGSAANGGAAGTSTSIAASFETVKLVFGGGGGITTCAAAPCHGVNGVAPPDDPLELPTNNDDQLYATLTSYVSRACGEIKLVDPGKPAQSALVTILKGPCGMTPRMPYGCSVEAGDCIPDEYIEAVAQWIANGAPRE